MISHVINRVINDSCVDIRHAKCECYEILLMKFYHEIYCVLNRVICHVLFNLLRQRFYKLSRNLLRDILRDLLRDFLYLLRT